MIRKDVMFAIVTTFCLCALMFAVMPIRSQVPYDPWADINDDGKINMYDIGYTAQRFGATGDLTKNVNVTNWPEPQYTSGKSEAINITWLTQTIPTSSASGTPLVTTGGYSKMSFLIEPLDISINGVWGPKFLTVSILCLQWTTDPNNTVMASVETVENVNVTISGHTALPEPVFNPVRANLFDVKGPYCTWLMWAQWYNNDPALGATTGWVTVRVHWYLRND